MYILLCYYTQTPGSDPSMHTRRHIPTLSTAYECLLVYNITRGIILDRAASVNTASVVWYCKCENIRPLSRAADRIKYPRTCKNTECSCSVGGAWCGGEISSMERTLARCLEQSFIVIIVM